MVDHVEPRGGWPTWVLSNHDRVRQRTRYGSEERSRAAAVLLLTLRGTPFLYAGEEMTRLGTSVGLSEFSFVRMIGFLKFPKN